MRYIANECGLDFDQPQTEVVDFFNNVGGDPTVVVSQNFMQPGPILGSGNFGPILFNGIGHVAPSSASSPLVYKVLVGSSQGYSGEVDRRVVDSYGTDTLLVTAIQTRNNARLIFTGSLNLFSNEYFISQVEYKGKKFPKSGNEEFVNEIMSWCFGGRGILKATNLQHRLSDKSGQANPLAYRINDLIDFSIDMSEWDPVTNNWIPFKANDVQLNFVMIDPYIRTTLKHNNNGHYSVSFQVPDVYGVYKFILKYEKLGYSFLEVSEQVSVHPFRHNQFERFLVVAYPYYASAFSMMAGFFLFGLVFLYSKN